MKWWQTKKRDADLERELQSDLELEEEEQRERGLSSEEARYAALRAFGNPTLIRELTPPGHGAGSIRFWAICAMDLVECVIMPALRFLQSMTEWCASV